MTAVLDLSALAKTHEAVAGASLTVAGSTERRNIPKLHQPFHNLIERSLIGYIELFGICWANFLLITADGGAGTTTDLGDTETNDFLADFLALSRGDDHAGVRNGNADQSAEFGKDLIADSIVEGVWINVVSALDSRNADRVRADSVNGFKMFSVHQKTGKLILVQLQTKENTETDIIDATLHRAVHRFGVVAVVVLRTGRVKGLIALFVIGLLEQNVGSDSGFLELSVILHSRGCNVDIDSADRSVLVLDGVDRIDTLENVLDRVVERIFAGLDGKTLMSHILKSSDLSGDLLLCQLLARDMAVLAVVRAVNTAVDAVVGEVERANMTMRLP